MANAVECRRAAKNGRGPLDQLMKKAAALAAALALGLGAIVGSATSAYAEGEVEQAAAPTAVATEKPEKPAAEPKAEAAAPAAEQPAAPSAEEKPEPKAEAEQRKGSGAGVDETAQPAAPPAAEAKAADPEPVKQAALPVAAAEPQAAPLAVDAPPAPREVPVTITDATFADNGKPLIVGQTIRFDAKWRVSDDAKAGDHFTMTLPSEFTPTSRNQFPLVDSASSSVLANCSWAGITATCTFTDRVEDIQSGNIWFTMTAKDETADDVNEVSFLFGSTTVGVKLPGGIAPKPAPPGDGGGSNPSPGTKAPTAPSKAGYPQSDSGKFSWAVTIPAGGDTLSVVDRLNDGAGFEAHHYVGAPALYSQAVNEEGYLTGGWSRDTSFTAANGSYTISADSRSLTVNNHPLDPSKAYRLNYDTQADNQLYSGDKVGNSVSVRGQELTRSVEFKALAGGGGDPSELGRFLIKKVVVGDDADAVPADTAFAVKATWSGGGEELILRADGAAVQSKRVKGGTTVTLSEVDLPKLDGLVWGEPKLTGAGVVDNGDGTFSVTPQAGEVVELVLTNTATKAPGSFSIEKLLRGEAASKVPAGTEFTVTYQVDAGEPVRAALTVGRPLVVDGVPAGSQVTVTEVDLPEVAGVVWGAPAFTVDGSDAGQTASFTVGRAQQVKVELANTATDRPLADGSFSVEKLVTGEATGKVPAGTEFTVVYQLGDGAPVQAVLTVGRPLVVSGVPAGSQVTVTEVNLPHLEDVIWGAPAFTVDGAEVGQSATFRVGEAQQVQVQLVNTTTLAPPVLGWEDEEDEDAGTPTGELPFTGSDGSRQLLLAGLAMILTGAGLVLVRRRRAES